MFSFKNGVLATCMYALVSIICFSNSLNAQCLYPPKLEVPYTDIQTYETEEYSIEFTEPICRGYFCEVQAVITNKTNKYLSIDESKIYFDADFGKIKVKHTPGTKVYIKPNSSKSRSYQTTGKGLCYQVDSLRFIFDGVSIYTLNESSTSKGEVIFNTADPMFTTGNFSCVYAGKGLKDFECSMVYRCKYTGDKLGIIEQGNAVAHTNSGDQYRSVYYDEPHILAEPSNLKTVKFLFKQRAAFWNSDPVISYNNCFTELDPADISGVTVQFYKAGLGKQSYFIGQSKKIAETPKPTISQNKEVATIPKPVAKVVAKPALPQTPNPVSISNVEIVDSNQNGLLEASESGKILVTINNPGSSSTGSMLIDFATAEKKSGILFSPQVSIANVPAHSEQTFQVPLTAYESLGTKGVQIKMTLRKANFIIDKDSVELFTKGNQCDYLMVQNHQYKSPNNMLQKNTPISFSFELYNPGLFPAKNVGVKYTLPEGMIPLSSIQESVPIIETGQKASLVFKFIVTDVFTDSIANVGLEIEDIQYTNISQLDMNFKLNSTLIASKTISAAPEKYRGDPLAGINVSTAKKEMEVGNYYALIIGIDEYTGTWTPLDNAVRDAQAVELTLKSLYRFDSFHTLYNQSATRSNIFQELEWLVNNVQEKDNVLIYYSGHGEFNQKMNKGYWVPVDASSNYIHQYIPNSDIQAFLGGIKSKHTLLITDACFSGDIFRGKTVNIPFEDNEKYFGKVHGLTSRQAISSGGIEPVMDGGQDGHSIFTYYVLKALKNNTSKYYDATQLFQSIRTPVINNSEQSPNFAPIKNTGDEGGQFIFIRN